MGNNKKVSDKWKYVFITLVALLPMFYLAINVVNEHNELSKYGKYTIAITTKITEGTNNHESIYYKFKVNNQIFESSMGLGNSENIITPNGKYLLVYHKDRPILNRILLQYNASKFKLGDELDSLIDKEKVIIPYLD